MSELPQIVSVTSAGPFALDIRFANGASGIWKPDVGAWRGPMATPLRSADYFARAIVEQGGIAWPNGFDASPEAVWSDLKSAGALRPPTYAAE